MAPRFRIAAVLLVTSILTGVGGYLLIQKARAIPTGARERPREVAGVVLEVATARCGTRSRPGTCYRPIVGYTHESQPKQVASRSLYRPAPLRQGDAAPVLVEDDGTAWIASEWDSRQVDLERDAASARRFPFIMGSLLLAGGAFGVLLSAGIAFFVDRSPPTPKGRNHA